MTAEEVALTEFREAVWLCRHARMWRDKARMWRERHLVRALARIIRAIRAERTPFHAMEKRLAGSIEGGIEAGIALIKARAYEQGRRDALREAIDLCRRTEAGDTNHDWREAAKCCRELIESLAAKAAEELHARARAANRGDR